MDLSHIFKANPTGANQYTKGKASGRADQDEFDRLGEELEALSAKIGKQKGPATREQSQHMKDLAAKRRSLMKQIEGQEEKVSKQDFPLPGRLGRFGG